MLGRTKFIRVGRDVRIAKTAVFKRPRLISFGSHVAVDHGVYCTTQLYVGSYVHISPYVTIIGGQDAALYMKDFSGMAAGCRVACASDEYKGFGLTNPTIPSAYRDYIINIPVTFERFVTLGSDVVVSPGCVLNEGAVVGANSFLPTGFVSEPWEMLAGSPVRRIGKREGRERLRAYAEELMNEDSGYRRVWWHWDSR